MALGSLMRLVRVIQEMDTKVRESSLVGESEMDRESRRLMAWICRGATAILVLCAVVPGLIRLVKWVYFEE
jgi:hypothetical protein